MSSAETRRVVGVDIGGTSVKIGVADSSGSRHESGGVAIGERPSAAELLDRIAACARELAGVDISGCGIGVPGLLDRETQLVTQSPNLPWLEDFDLRSELADRLGIALENVHLENDANVAAVGEAWLGAARGQSDVLVATLGTGVGGGLILGGQLFVGSGLAGEIGHVTIDPNGPRCGCGARGCLETFASATAARRRALELGLPEGAPGDLPGLAAAARAGEPRAAHLLTAIGRDLGHGLAAAVSLLDVRSFVIGGGFSATFDTLEMGIRTGLREWAFGDRVAGIQLAQAALGGEAGWLGAARLALPAQ